MRHHGNGGQMHVTPFPSSPVTVPVSAFFLNSLSTFPGRKTTTVGREELPSFSERGLFRVGEFAGKMFPFLAPRSLHCDRVFYLIEAMKDKNVLPWQRSGQMHVTPFPRSPVTVPGISFFLNSTFHFSGDEKQQQSGKKSSHLFCQKGSLFA
ncbi:hypothetical protein CEXT_605611 [Caerostris extrusa]|uniref:Uncharacterized protein n=1 Tax=Caerostris extrusa TaxID=172846 RepID=A0AAV4Y5X3_CAEEX|nr:hypothetical protein CEXT_605611 [Caerostris extrusa]